MRDYSRVLAVRGWEGVARLEDRTLLAIWLQMSGSESSSRVRHLLLTQQQTLENWTYTWLQRMGSTGASGMYERRRRRIWCKAARCMVATCTYKNGWTSRVLMWLYAKLSFSGPKPGGWLIMQGVDQSYPGPGTLASLRKAWPALGARSEVL